jgi:hypothetical protein
LRWLSAPIHRLWADPSARTHGWQLDLSHLPEILRAQRRHAALTHHPDYWRLHTAIREATHAIYQVLTTATGPKAAAAPAPARPTWCADPMAQETKDRKQGCVVGLAADDGP